MRKFKVTKEQFESEKEGAGYFHWKCDIDVDGDDYNEHYDVNNLFGGALNQDLSHGRWLTHNRKYIVRPLGSYCFLYGNGKDIAPIRSGEVVAIYCN